MKVLLIVAVVCANACATNLVAKLVLSYATGSIVNGEETAPHSAPYIVSLSKDYTKHSHECSGTLIGKEWIIAAAQCVFNPVGMGVQAGLHNRSDINEKVQSRKVDFGKLHSSYIAGAVGLHDIALLHVSQPFIIYKWVQPAILPFRREMHLGDARLYGWSQPADTLQSMKCEILDFKDCKARLPDNAPIADGNLCTESMGAGISAYNGDSGDPLVLEREGSKSELIAIASWAYSPCGIGNMTSVYTRISAYVDWIVDTQSAYYKLF